jgi:hypothetical protein
MIDFLGPAAIFALAVLTALLLMGMGDPNGR